MIIKGSNSSTVAQTVDKVNINCNLCILNEILCRGYFCYMNYVTIEGNYKQFDKFEFCGGNYGF